MPVEIKLRLGDSNIKLKELKDNSMDLIVTDPPYGISFMAKKWDTFKPGGAYEKKKGFKQLPRNKPFAMTEFFVPIWRECLRILKPGAFAFVMCAPRQDVLCKQIAALEQAGFNMGFTSIYWAYSSGFPKASNMGKMVDKRMGVKGEEYVREDYKKRSNKKAQPQSQVISGEKGVYHKIASEEGKKLAGSYSGFSPKPAVEIILVCMKPLETKSYIDQALKNKHGISWLDDARIPFKDDDKPENCISGGCKNTYQYSKQEGRGKGALYSADIQGRFPANLIVSNEVLNDGKVSKSSDYPYRAKGAHPGSWDKDDGSETQGYTDSGSFSRYFSLDSWWNEKLKHLSPRARKTFPFMIVPKAGKREKNTGCERLKDMQDKHKGDGLNRICEFCGTPQLKAELCKCKKKSWVLPKRKNNHPTCKPIKLMSYLITLGSRPGDVVCDPFMGSGTTGVACKILKRKFVGVEMQEDYFKIAQARIAAAEGSLL